MVDRNDWRWNGQEEYLTGIVLYHKAYRRYSPEWDHDHCAFCWDKFMERGDGEHTDALHEGYATEGDQEWICPECFADFHGQLGWTVVEVAPRL